jgi:hypothetical protein
MFVGTIKGEASMAAVLYNSLADTEVVCMASLPYLKAKTKF